MNETSSPAIGEGADGLACNVLILGGLIGCAVTVRRQQKAGSNARLKPGPATARGACQKTWQRKSGP